MTIETLPGPEDVRKNLGLILIGFVLHYTAVFCGLATFAGPETNSVAFGLALSIPLISTVAIHVGSFGFGEMWSKQKEASHR